MLAAFRFPLIGRGVLETRRETSENVPDFPEYILIRTRGARFLLLEIR
jgi:hypothetical protein